MALFPRVASIVCDAPRRDSESKSMGEAVGCDTWDSTNASQDVEAKRRRGISSAFRRCFSFHSSGVRSISSVPSRCRSRRARRASFGLSNRRHTRQKRLRHARREDVLDIVPALAFRNGETSSTRDDEGRSPSRARTKETWKRYCNEVVRTSKELLRLPRSSFSGKEHSLPS